MEFCNERFMTAKEMAEKEGVTINVIRNRIQRKGLDYSPQKAAYIRELVEEYFKNNPGATKSKAAKDLKMSLPTLRKYLNSSCCEDSTAVRKSKEKRNNTKSGLSVGHSDSEILRNIIDIYLSGNKTFDCDLTFGMGNFYSDGLQAPKYRYDKHTFGANGPKKYTVAPLDDTASLPDECFKSIVIDLPIVIDKCQEKTKDFNAFESLNEMFYTYHEMISLAFRLLNSGGILVFKTSDFVVRNDNNEYEGEWATDKAIEIALELGFELTDKFILVERKYLSSTHLGTLKIRAGLKHGFFLVFTKFSSK